MLEETYQKFERLPAELSQEISQFTPEFRATLASFAVEAADRGKADTFLQRAESLERKKGSLLWSAYLIAQLNNQMRRVEDWERALLKLGDRLLQATAPQLAREIADEILGSHPSAHAARLLVRAAEADGDAAALEAALEQAWTMDMGNPDVALRLAEQAKLRGDRAGELEWMGASLKGLAEADEWKKMDECILAVIDGDEESSQAAAIETLPLIYRGGDADKAAGYLDLGLPKWRSPNFAPLLEKTLRAIAERGSAPESVRDAYIATLRAQHNDFAELDEYLELSGLPNSENELAPAIKAWDLLWSYRPGVVVEHGSLGLGIIQKNDSNRILINFPKSPAHSMTVAFAQKSLGLIPANHLKAQLARDHEGTLGRFATDPAGTLANALEDLGGTAKNTDVKKYLTHLGFPASSFAAWWKKAKSAAKDHPRLDDHEAYRDVMHLVREGAGGEFRLPILTVKKGPRAAVTLVNRFVTQHPGALEQAKARYTPYFNEWLMDDGTLASDRAIVLLLLARWFPDHSEAWGKVAAELNAEEVDAPNWASPIDQRLWLELLGRDTRWNDTLPPFLGSRKTEMRQAARAELMARWKDRAPLELERLLERATELPSVTIALCTEAMNEPEIPSWANPWRVTVALLSILEGKSEEALAKEALRILDVEEGRLLSLVKNKEPEEDLGLTLERLVRYWRSSDRYFFPVLEFIKRTRAKKVAEDAEARRAEELRKLDIPTGDQTEFETTLMTRQTFERMVGELERLNRDLKTVIPVAIRKARELGDLKENAEYDAAKLKQRQTTQRCEQLEAAIRNIRLIEDLEISTETVGPGTEVTLAGPTGKRVLWMLGEGDNHIGEGVVSYRAPLGKQLIGHRVGDKLTLTAEIGEGDYEILSIRKLLPEYEARATISLLSKTPVRS